ncbi:hypothetical protein ON010_g1042 [Phytophthora cinnamomi]|nr:hypothetical protein ON010_g1042 [Phytophthora cinnamomi]
MRVLLLATVLLAHVNAQASETNTEHAHVSRVEAPSSRKYLRALKSPQEDDNNDEERSFGSIVKKATGASAKMANREREQKRIDVFNAWISGWSTANAYDVAKAHGLSEKKAEKFAYYVAHRAPWLTTGDACKKGEKRSKTGGK